MTTPSPANPGAVIDIKLSESALAHQNNASTLGSRLDALFETQRSVFNSDGILGKPTSGGTLSVTLPSGQILTFNGNKTEEQFEGRKLGAIGATSITATDPGVSTAMTKGLMSGAYSLGDQMVKLHLSATKISSYQFDSLNPAADPALGKTSTSYTGNLDPNLRSHPWWLGTSNFLSGDITTLSTRGTKLLRSEVLKGKLSIDANYDYAPPPEPLTSEVPAIYVIKTSFNTSTANSYDASYYDGSYLRMKSSTGVAVNASMKMPELLSDADLWSGDDDIKIDMPSYMQYTWNVNTGDGNDKISIKGGGGELMIDTGSGDDQITLLDNARNFIQGGDGIDTLRAGFSSVQLWYFSDIENFIFTGRTAVEVQGNELNNELSGGNQGDTIQGYSGDDILRGLAGNDTLDGGAGADVMWGGAGNDIYVVDNADDVVSEARSATNTADSGGKDTVLASINVTLGAGIENLTLLGDSDLKGSGNALANSITGNEGRNELHGDAGNDILDGGAGDDILDGGTGIDTMRGGTGNDIYYVDNAADLIVETISPTNKSAAGGIDTVISTISFTLGNNIENLKLDGVANINATGNAADNVINGNSGDNIINGKEGVDSMDGMAGSDFYLIGSADEHSGAEIKDSGTAGTDEIRFSPVAPVASTTGAAAIAPKLSLFAEDTGIERVVIGTGIGKMANTTGKIAADVDASAVQNQLTIIGNNGSNQLTGTEFDDTLVGNGGNDVLTGGLGADKFVFNMAPNAKTEVDSITDFVSDIDQLVFVRSKFIGISAGDTLQEAAFYAHAGATQAHDADDRFVFDTTSGHLYFDKDGSGSAAAVLIGVFNPATSLAATDFKIVDVF